MTIDEITDYESGKHFLLERGWQASEFAGNDNCFHHPDIHGGFIWTQAVGFYREPPERGNGHDD